MSNVEISNVKMINIKVSLMIFGSDVYVESNYFK